MNADNQRSFSQYRTLFKSLKKKKSKTQKQIKIGLLTSFTAKGLDEVLTVKCAETEIQAKVYLAPYGQYNQEIFDTSSGLYKFNPDLIILFIDSISFLGEYLLNPYKLSLGQRRKFINSKFDEIKALVKKLQKNSKAKILIHNFDIPTYSPLGILEGKQEFGFIDSIKKLNSKVKKLSLSDPSIFIFDYDLFCAKHGKGKMIDYKMYYLADLRLNLNYLLDLCDEYLSFIKPMLSIIKKCLVLDLDNTLWGGILGEAGFDGIDLGPTPKGRSFWEFQKYILSLHERGVILAINSRNNLDEVLKVINEHPYMVLKEENFSSIRANWKNKAENMKSIAKELNIGLNSFLYLDDDPYNRELIRKNLKEIIVIDLPEDTSLYLNTIKNITDFNTMQITDEDKKRGKMYAQARQRQKMEEEILDIEEFTKSLEVSIKIEEANKFSIPRISQLTQKTNQFNMTTRRYLEDQIEAFNKSNDYLVYSAQVADKFGDYGLTGVLIIEKKDTTWIINNLLLSCRVLGRKVEESILFFLIRNAKKHKVKKVVGEFIKTEKNKPAEDFYRRNNFKLREKLNEIEIWDFDFNLDYKSPDYVKILTA